MKTLRNIPKPPPPPEGRTIIEGRAVRKSYQASTGLSKYRVKQTADKCFEVQKLFYETKTTGVLFWKKTESKFVYHTIDRLERKRFYYTNLRGIHSNEELLLKFKTLKKAKQAIQGLVKYPIYH